MKLYRFECNGIGINEAVSKYCIHEDIRRKVKPDDSWFKNVGQRNPNFVSYWTEAGLNKYIDSWLQDWQRSVVPYALNVKIADVDSNQISKLYYSDELQVIGDNDLFIGYKNLDINHFFIDRSQNKIVQKVASYVVKIVGSKKYLLLFRHLKYPDLGLQFPAGTVDGSESSEDAAVRELEEESGLKLPILTKLGEFAFYKTYSQQYQNRHVYLFDGSNIENDTWVHAVKSSGDDHDLEFEYYWCDIDDLDPNVLKMEGVANSIEIAKNYLLSCY